MANSPPEIIYGAAGLAGKSSEELAETFAVLRKHNVKILDTASLYTDSERTLGENDASKEFTIHTKAPAITPGSLAKQSVLDGMEKSLKDLGVESVDTYYLHTPDTATPIEETLEAIRELYAAGRFKRFGLSNYLPADVQKIHTIQTSHSSILPTLFQGNYNAVARHMESPLLPLLRQLNMSFYAYSPIAGGFLTKDSAALRTSDVEGRFGEKTALGDMYTKLYGNETLYGALDEWGRIAKAAGVEKAALAYRWIVHHSALSGLHGDGVIIGARNPAQLEQTLTAIEEGPLGEETVAPVERVWEMCRGEAPRDNWVDYLAGKA